MDALEHGKKQARPDNSINDTKLGNSNRLGLFLPTGLTWFVSTYEWSHCKSNYQAPSFHLSLGGLGGCLRSALGEISSRHFSLAFCWMKPYVCMTIFFYGQPPFFYDFSHRNVSRKLRGKKRATKKSRNVGEGYWGAPRRSRSTLSVLFMASFPQGISLSRAARLANFDKTLPFSCHNIVEVGDPSSPYPSPSPFHCWKCCCFRKWPPVTGFLIENRQFE